MDFLLDSVKTIENSGTLNLYTLYFTERKSSLLFHTIHFTERKRKSFFYSTLKFLLKMKIKITIFLPYCTISKLKHCYKKALEFPKPSIKT